MKKLENLGYWDIVGILANTKSRYPNTDVPLIVEFVKAGAIDIFYDNLGHIDRKLEHEELIGVRGPQQYEKNVTLKLFEELGIKPIGLEFKFNGSFPDAVGKNGDILIIVECGPCYTHKPIQHLTIDNLELWLVAEHKPEDSSLHICRRGSNWNKIYEAYDKARHEETMRKYRQYFDTPKQKEVKPFDFVYL